MSQPDPLYDLLCVGTEYDIDAEQKKSFDGKILIEALKLRQQHDDEFEIHFDPDIGGSEV